MSVFVLCLIFSWVMWGFMSLIQFIILVIVVDVEILRVVRVMKIFLQSFMFILSFLVFFLLRLMMFRGQWRSVILIMFIMSGISIIFMLFYCKFVKFFRSQKIIVGSLLYGLVRYFVIFMRVEKKVEIVILVRIKLRILFLMRWESCYIILMVSRLRRKVDICMM